VIDAKALSITSIFKKIRQSGRLMQKARAVPLKDLIQERIINSGDSFFWKGDHKTKYKGVVTKKGFQLFHSNLTARYYKVPTAACHIGIFT
jgi:hypothetical protein